MKESQITIKMPPHLTEAAENEAARRGITVSALVKNYLSNFLPANIGKTIINTDAPEEVRP